QAYSMDGEMPGSSSSRPFSKASRDLWTAVLFEEDFGGAAPDHDLTIGFGFEFGDVVPDLVGEIALVFAGPDFLRGKTFDVVLVKDGGHGLDGFEIRADLFELVAVEDLSGSCGIVEIATDISQPVKTTSLRSAMGAK